jgi:RNA polymerase sigma-70 factor (ECF subfamily)
VAVAGLERTTAFERLLRTHQAGVWRYLRFLGAAPVEADDLAQETFVEVWRRPFVEVSERASAAYLRRVARSRFLMRVRTERRRPPVASLEDLDRAWEEWLGGEEGAAGARSGWDERLDALERCLEGVKARARDALDLRYREGLARESIAERLGLSVEGVKTLLRRVLEALRECMERRLG